MKKVKRAFGQEEDEENIVTEVYILRYYFSTF